MKRDIFCIYCAFSYANFRFQASFSRRRFRFYWPAGRLFDTASIQEVCFLPDTITVVTRTASVRCGVAPIGGVACNRFIHQQRTRSIHKVRLLLKFTVPLPSVRVCAWGLSRVAWRLI